jgi:GTP-binding protein
MRFVDQCRVKVTAGEGGNGAVAFRREKYIPFGGPSGGDGGRGGDVVLVGDEGMSTLIDFTHVRTLLAKRGEHGSGSDCHGRAGEGREERVPVGTEIRDHDTGELLADVTAHGQRVVVAKGGKGGRGNIRFATAIDRAPRRHDAGEPGETRELDLTLKVMADVGLIGFPNVGKSTFVAAVSAARPKIADYPFTTLAPMLGVVEVGGGARSGGTNFVVADIPGLIPGASEGIGLGIRFLQHVERTRVLLHLVTLDAGDDREPLADYRALRRELRTFSPELSGRPEVVVLSKADLTDVKDAYPALQQRFAAAGIKLRLMSAATREGVEALINDLYRITRGDVRDDERPPPEVAVVARAKKKAATKKAATKKKVAAKKKAAPKKAAPKKAAPKKRAAPKKKTAVKKKTAAGRASAKAKVPAKPRTKLLAKKKAKSKAAATKMAAKGRAPAAKKPVTKKRVKRGR